MERQEFASYLNLLEKMSSEELAELEDQVRSLRSGRKGRDALEHFDQSMRDARRCPHCGRDKVYKHGRDSRGSQRFRCRPPSRGGCGRTFNGRTGTPFARMRKPERWSLFLQALSAGHRSLDDLHKFGEVGVSRRTLWRRRKVVLETLRDRIEEGCVLCTAGFSTCGNVARDAAVATHVVLRIGAEPTVN
jgi:transposase-like protein